MSRSALSRNQIAEMVQVFLASTSNEVRLEQERIRFTAIEQALACREGDRRA